MNVAVIPIKKVINAPHYFSPPLLTLHSITSGEEGRRHSQTNCPLAYGHLGRDLNKSRGRERAVRWSLIQWSRPVNRWHRRREAERTVKEDPRGRTAFSFVNVSLPVLVHY